MDLVSRLTTFEEEERTNPQLAFWLTRSPAERLAEVERLRREYISGLKGAQRDGCATRLCGPLLLIDREQR